MTSWGKRGAEDLARMRQIFPVVDAIRATAEAGGARYMMMIHPDQTQMVLKLAGDIFSHTLVSTPRSMISNNLRSF
jgi:hypothetical protein